METKGFVVFAAILIVSGCLNTGSDGGGSMSGKKVLMVVAPLNFRDEELLIPKKVFEDAGVKVVIASKDVAQARGMMGELVTVDVDLYQVSAADYDAIVFVGGGGAKSYFEDEIAHLLAKSSVNQGKVTAAICIAPAILAKAGVLKGKRATIWTSVVDKSMVSVIDAGGGAYSDAEVVVHGKVITGCGPDAGEKFAEKILEAIA